jgi:hypothetical protein
MGYIWDIWDIYGIYGMNWWMIPILPIQRTSLVESYRKFKVKKSYTLFGAPRGFL